MKAKSLWMLLPLIAAGAGAEVVVMREQVFVPPPIRLETPAALVNGRLPNDPLDLPEGVLLVPATEEVP